MNDFERAFQLLESQRFDEGYQILKKFVKREPKFGDAWYLMAQVDREFGRWDSAIEHMKKAVATMPDNRVYIEYLAMMRLFGNRGRDIALAIDGFALLINDAPQSPGAEILAANLLTIALRSGLSDRVLASVKPLIESHPPQSAERLRLAAAVGVSCFIAGDLVDAERFAGEAFLAKNLAYDEHGKQLPGDNAYYYIYAQYVLMLMDFRRKHPAFYDQPAKSTLHAIGESHALGPSGMVLNAYRVQSHLMMGCKAYYYTVPHGEPWQFHLTRLVQSVPKDEPLMVLFGEIDCRPDEGIMRQVINQPGYQMESEVAALVAAYVKYVKIAQLRRLAPCYVCGVPASHAMRQELLLPEQFAAFLAIIKHFNACLKVECAKQGLPFVDVYAVTVGTDGWAKPDVHLDEVHLRPSVLDAAFAAVVA